MIARAWAALAWLHAKVGTLPMLVLTLLVLYSLYVVKHHLGIDIFPNWGLHLPGPRTLVRMIAHKIDAL